MGQIHSILDYTSPAKNNNLDATLSENFSCNICLEILHDPVQCRNNEHYFCRKCITKHLHDNSETCPLCADHLTLETLRSVPRVVLDVVSQLNRPRCIYVSRGCTENVTVEELLLHEQKCGYAPVVCANEGCKETVNRRDKESHEKTECKFRMITCESCAEEMTYHDYCRRHQCTMTLRREMKEIKLRLNVMNETLQHIDSGTKHKIKLATNDQRVRTAKQSNQQQQCRTIPSGIPEENVVAKGKIFIFGGSNEESGKSFEVFNWSTKTWTLFKNRLFFRRFGSFSFLYGKKIMVCGGKSTERIEYLNPSENEYCATVHSVSLPRSSISQGVLHQKRIVTFCSNVVGTSLESTGQSRTLMVRYSRDQRNVDSIQLIGNSVYIIGGGTCSMEKYDATENKLTTLPALPYEVSYMATVAYKDNIIILGGLVTIGNKSNPVNDVVMFNVTSQEYKKLPSMLEKRAGCAAVIVGDVIVVMGGYCRDFDGQILALNTAEYYVVGHSRWQILPAMNLARSGPTACVYD